MVQRCSRPLLNVAGQRNRRNCVWQHCVPGGRRRRAASGRLSQCVSSVAGWLGRWPWPVPPIGLVCCFDCDMSGEEFFKSLFGYRTAALPENVLPTTLDVLRVFFFHVHECRKTIADAALLTARHLRSVWLQLDLVPFREQSCVARIKSLQKQCDALRKSHVRGGPTHDLRLASYKLDLAEVLDVEKKEAALPDRVAKRKAESLARGRKAKRPKQTLDVNGNFGGDGECDKFTFFLYLFRPGTARF